MKSCTWIKNHLHDFLDEELPAHEILHLEEHVAECLDCQHALAKARSMRAHLRSMPICSVPDTFNLQLKMRILAAEGSGKRLRDIEPAPFATRALRPALFMGVAALFTVAFFSTPTTVVQPAHIAQDSQDVRPHREATLIAEVPQIELIDARAQSVLDLLPGETPEQAMDRLNRATAGRHLHRDSSRHRTLDVQQVSATK